ncbi:hypothetical protein HYN48_10150 [Flavobacterium magnum]|uniref:Seryl-tRNA synthetase n=1 Tax=Flavobacterium magnum TaxID=2162713 RepID=A0A2S0RH16_9FLAO|nr:hypothetical protein [Flavobacterium magnum]AWA30421.1 hypothetical protein HYN48_10150 [Flavobacterium magnum]
MKKSTLYLMMMLFTLAITPTVTYASTPVTTTLTADPTNEMPARVKLLTDRLEEIKAMDKSDLSRAERKALRKEVRAIKSELRTTNGGVYLSVGAIIIIILLLILLL